MVTALRLYSESHMGLPPASPGMSHTTSHAVSLQGSEGPELPPNVTSQLEARKTSLLPAGCAASRRTLGVTSDGAVYESAHASNTQGLHHGHDSPHGGMCTSKTHGSAPGRACRDLCASCNYRPTRITSCGDRNRCCSAVICTTQGPSMITDVPVGR